MSVALMIKLYKLLKSISGNSRSAQQTHTLVYQDNCDAPYSFLHFLFVGKDAVLSPIVLDHELVHIRQKHSWDILLLELLKIVNWFNPAIYLIQYELKTVHELLADQQTTAQNTTKDDYVNHLINHAGKVRIGVVSGGSREAVQKTLKVLGIDHLVEALVCAGETEHGKPYPDPFLKAALELGVAPEHCLVFEDGDAGIQAAEAAGMRWVRIDKLI